MVDIAFIKDTIQDIVIDVFKNHPHQQKRRINSYSDRVNFACPYCGDSHDNPTAKRANIYLNTLKYVCFNCGRKTTFENFCNNHNVTIDFEQKLRIIEYLDTTQTHYHNYQEDLMESEMKQLISLDSFINKCNNSSISTFPLKLLSPIKTGSLQDLYLEERKIIGNKRKYILQGRYYYSEKYYNEVVVFLNANKDNLIGIQVRNLEKDSKKRMFKIYNYQQLCTHLFPENLETLSSNNIHLYNKLSYLFSILNVNFDKKITIFEGYLDSLFFPNSIGSIGVNSDIDFLLQSDLELRFFYDNDTEGMRKSEEEIKKNSEVFLWNKLFNDIADRKSPKDYYHYLQRIKRVKDLNKLEMLIDNTYKTLNLEKYFSKDVFDLIYINKETKKFIKYKSKT